ncbi:hypothetical protein PENTCL1PPCAC_7445, partial [Pristionchus entomophagus]
MEIVGGGVRWGRGRGTGTGRRDGGGRRMVDWSVRGMDWQLIVGRSATRRDGRDHQRSVHLVQRAPIVSLSLFIGAHLGQRSLQILRVNLLILFVPPSGPLERAEAVTEAATEHHKSEEEAGEGDDAEDDQHRWWESGLGGRGERAFQSLRGEEEIRGFTRDSTMRQWASAGDGGSVPLEDRLIGGGGEGEIEEIARVENDRPRGEKRREWRGKRGEERGIGKQGGTCNVLRTPVRRIHCPSAKVFDVLMEINEWGSSIAAEDEKMTEGRLHLCHVENETRLSHPANRH